RYGYLLAATGNEAYNALVSTEFAPEIGRNRVFQLGAADSDDPHALSHTVRGQTLFKSGMDLAELQRRHFAGWSFQRTKLSDKFGFEDYLAQRPEGSEILVVVKKNKALSFATAAARPKVEAGDIVIAYAPPTAADKTEQKPKRQDNKPQLPG
ncbi:MAG: sodium:proton antiporter, partial [Alphaproteobacteria bacterium]